MKTTKIVLSLVGAALLTLVILALRKLYMDQQLAAARATGTLPDGRAASDDDKLRCKRNVFLGIGADKNKQFCACEAYYPDGQNPVLELACKTAAAAGARFTSRQDFEAKIGTQTVQAAQQQVAVQQQQAAQMQQAQNALLQQATAPAAAGGNTTLYAGIGLAVLAVGGALYWKSSQKPSTAVAA